MSARLTWRYAAGLAAAAAVTTMTMTMLASASTGLAQNATARPPDGAALYKTYCASCHGRTGRGEGPVAEFLKIPPSDLTRIASRANGVFPAFAVGRIIDGRQIARAHGDSAMPVWGDAFSQVASVRSEAEVRARIDALVKYLEAMQPRKASNAVGAAAVAP